MPVRTFVTISDELLEVAEVAAARYESRGWTLDVEPSELAYPYTPTLRATRQTTCVLAEVVPKLDMALVEEWVRYGRSCNSDTRLTLVISRDLARTADEEAGLRELGVGLVTVAAGRAREEFPARDLAMNVELPSSDRFSQEMIGELGEAYEEFERAEWRDGFERACQAIERTAKRYLRDGISAGRIVVVNDSGVPANPTPRQIDRFTLGNLARAYDRILNKNYADNVIGSALETIRIDRNNLIHARGEAATEESLRRNVRQHMWVVVAGMRALLGES